MNARNTVIAVGQTTVEARALPTKQRLSKRDTQTGETMFNWFQRLLPRTGDFFGMFDAHAATLVAAADALAELAEGKTPPQQPIAEINKREHEADATISAPEWTCMR